MTAPRLRSLQLRLAMQLAALFVVGSAAIVGVLVWRAYDTAGTLADRELSLRAADLAKYVAPAPDGTPRLALPAALREAYGAAPDADIFAVRAGDGRLVAALPEAFGSVVERWPATTDDPSYFHLPGLAGKTQDYYGLGISVDSAAGPLSIWVARAAGATALVHSLLEEFVLDIAWVIPLFMLLALGVAILAIRSTLRPIREVSEIAASIGPSATSVRLPQANLPNEIVPLVSAVNRALGRLEQGFAVQRQFTANAAHELRTPLAIITGALDNMEPNPEVGKLKVDVARMNRLVEQLLSVARLDAIALDVSGTVDLNDVAHQAVANLAPWALAQGPDPGLRRRRSAVHCQRQRLCHRRRDPQPDRECGRPRAAAHRSHGQRAHRGQHRCQRSRAGRAPAGPRTDLRALLARQGSAFARRRIGARHRRGDHESTWRQRRGQRRAAWRRGLHARLFTGIDPRSSGGRT